MTNRRNYPRLRNGTLEGGGINIMFANALHNVYKDNAITEKGLETGFENLPDYLAEKVRADLQTDC